LAPVAIVYLAPMSSSETAIARSQPVTTIRPPRRWPGLGFVELWEYRELIGFLAKRELQVRYKQTLLGVSWAVLQPLGLAFMFAVLFGNLLHIPTGGIPYPLFAVVAIVPWTFAAQTINQGSQALVNDAPLLNRVYFPRLALPIAKGLGLVVDLAIALAVTLIFVLIYGSHLNATALLAPLFVALGAVTAFALATWFSAIYVQYRDMVVVVPVVVQVLLFLSPLIYPSTLIKGNWQYVYALNPFASMIDGMRWTLAGGPAPGAVEVLISVCSALVLTLVAIVYFRRSEPHFADVV
jgi:homopolymeric O-antigen transport system permease protein